MTITPFINFTGLSAAAISHYSEVFKLDVNDIVYFKEIPYFNEKYPEYRDKVMHASLTLNGSQLVFSDGDLQGINDSEKFANKISLTIEFDNVAELKAA